VSLLLAGNPPAQSQQVNSMEHIEAARIVVTRVPDAERINFLPRHFGRQMLIVERAVFAHLENLCADYRGGYWNFLELSNGGCYLAPSEARGYRILVEGNGFSGNLDADCAGIVATLFALSHLSMRFPNNERFAERFHQLRDFACEHPDGNLIMAAID
jgi:hypothetical protein